MSWSILASMYIVQVSSAAARFTAFPLSWLCTFCHQNPTVIIQSQNLSYTYIGCKKRCCALCNWLSWGLLWLLFVRNFNLFTSFCKFWGILSAKIIANVVWYSMVQADTIYGLSLLPNFILKVRHSRQKCPKLSVLLQKRLILAFLQQKNQYF